MHTTYHVPHFIHHHGHTGAAVHIHVHLHRRPTPDVPLALALRRIEILAILELVNICADVISAPIYGRSSSYRNS